LNLLSDWKKKKYDIEAMHIQTLSQKLVSKLPHLKDYACNVNADKIALLDFFIKAYEDDAEFVDWLKGLREQILRMGEAYWVMNADVLTNLGLKVGKTGVIEIDGKNRDSETEI